jgi:thiol-disulfide isomerase/thioredoxin
LLPKKAIIFVSVACVVVGALFGSAILLGRLESQPEVTKTVESGSAATPSVIYATSFPDLKGQPQSLGQWSNKLLVINFWATWCAPCLEEMPIFVRLQAQYGAKGLQIVGIAADSSPNAAKFVEKLKINYPVLPDESRAIEFSKRTGNRLGLLPYTIILNAKGEVVLTKLGVFKEAEITEIIKNNLPD